MMRTWAVVCLIGMWVVSAGLLVASGVALRAAMQRRLVLGSRLFVWREPMRVLEGREAACISLTLLVISLVLALFFLATAIMTTRVLVRALVSLP
jgi:hypothetical protein